MCAAAAALYFVRLLCCSDAMVAGESGSAHRCPGMAVVMPSHTGGSAPGASHLYMHVLCIAADDV